MYWEQENEIKAKCDNLLFYFLPITYKHRT